MKNKITLSFSFKVIAFLLFTTLGNFLFSPVFSQTQFHGESITLPNLPWHPPLPPTIAPTTNWIFSFPFGVHRPDVANECIDIIPCYLPTYFVTGQWHWRHVGTNSWHTTSDINSIISLGDKHIEFHVLYNVTVEQYDYTNGILLSSLSYTNLVSSNSFNIQVLPRLNAGTLHNVAITKPDGRTYIDCLTPPSGGNLRFRFDINLRNRNTGAITTVSTPVGTSTSIAFAIPNDQEFVSAYRVITNCLNTVNFTSSPLNFPHLRTNVVTQHINENHINPGTIAFSNSQSSMVSCTGGLSLPIIGTVASTGTSVQGTYFWQLGSTVNNVTTWSNISGQVNQNLISQPVLATSPQVMLFRRGFVVGSSVTYSNIVELIRADVNPGVIVTTPEEVCLGTVPATILNVTGPSSTNNLPFETVWGQKLAIDPADPTLIPGATSLNYSPTALHVPDGFTVRYFDIHRGVRATSGVNCPVRFTPPKRYYVARQFRAGTISIANTHVCFNSSGNTLNNVTLPTGGFDSKTYRWESSHLQTGPFTPIPGNQSSLILGPQTTTLWYRRIDNAGCGELPTNAVLSNVFSELRGGNILASQTVCHNTQPALLSNVLSPSGGNGTFTFRWESSPNGTTWSVIPGATNATYLPPVLQQTTHYRRIAINLCGEAISNVSLVTVRNALNPGVISANQFVCFDSNVNILSSVAPSGGDGNFTFQWFLSTNNVTYTPIPNATLASLTHNNVTTRLFFRRVASNTCGVVTSNTVQVDITPDFSPPVIGSNQSICSGVTPTAINIIQPLSGGLSQPSLQWQQSSNGVDNWSNVGVINSSSFQPGALTSDMFYRLRLTGPCNVLFSNVVHIDVLESLHPGSISSNQTICFGIQPSLISEINSPSTNSGVVSFQWENSIDGNVWSIIPNATSSTFLPPVLLQTTHFRRVAINACEQTISNVSVVNVHNDLNPGVIGANSLVCFNSNAQINSIHNPTGGDGIFTYQWFLSNDNQVFIPLENATLVSHTHNNIRANLFFRRVAHNTCGSRTSNTLEVKVSTEFIPPIIGLNQNICLGAVPASINVTQPASGGSGVVVLQWQHSPNGLTNWTNVGTLNSTSFQPGQLTSDMFYRLQITDLCGIYFSNVIKVDVSNQLQSGVIGTDETICYGTSPRLISELTTPSGGSGAFSFRWEQRSENSSFWQSIIGAYAATYLPGILTENTLFRRIAINNCGEAFSNVVTISVTPEFKPGSIVHKGWVCQGELVGAIRNLEFASGGFGNFTYEFEKSTDGQTWGKLSGMLPESNYGALERNTTFRRIAKSPGCPDVVSEPLTVILDPIRADFSVSANSLTIGEPVQFICQSTNAFSHLWVFSEGESRTEQSPWVFFNMPGQVSATLTVRSRNNCVSRLSLNNVLELRLPTNSNNITRSEFILYPNPTDVAFTINAENKELIQSVVIKNMQGQIVYQSIYFDSHINVSHLEPGVYFVSVIFSNETIIQKLIIQ